MAINIIDEDWDTDISIWVSTTKNADEFQEILAEIISPVAIQNRIFKIGAIRIKINDVTEQPSSFGGIPQDNYSFELVVPTTTSLIWGCFDKRVIYALTLGLRSKITCSYLVTTDANDFVFYSGSNKPYYLNLNYQSCVNGELMPIIKDKSNVVEVRI